MEMFKDFTFDAAHSLPHAPAGHKCARLHGHTYNVTVTLSGPVDDRFGWIMDFGELKALVSPVIDQLDHRHLNELPDLANPTSENVARWIWERLTDISGLSAVTVRETCTAGVVYRGE